MKQDRGVFFVFGLAVGIMLCVVVALADVLDQREYTEITIRNARGERVRCVLAEGVDEKNQLRIACVPISPDPRTMMAKDSTEYLVPAAEAP